MDWVEKRKSGLLKILEKNKSAESSSSMDTGGNVEANEFDAIKKNQSIKNDSIKEAETTKKAVSASNDSRHPSVTNDNGLASSFDEGVFLLKEMRPDKIIQK